LVKLANDGTVVWERTRPNSPFYNLTLDPDGNVFVAGSSSGDHLIVKFDPAGDEEWDYIDTEGWYSRILWDEGFIYASGVRMTPPFPLGFAAAVVKLSAAGSESWRSGYDGASFESAYGTDLALDAQKNVYLSAYTVGMESGIGVVTRFDGQSGQGGWVQLFADGPLPINSVNRIAVRGDRVIALGLTLYKMTAETGDLDWTYRLPGAQGRDMALDSSAIYICGHGAAGLIVQKLEEATTAVAGTPPVAEMLRITAPNPLQAGMEIRITMPAAERLHLGVFDVSGRLVRTLRDGATSLGVHRVVWDERNAAGRSLAPGVYFLRAEAAQGATTAKVVISGR
jgi:hypothetical protein